MAQVTGPQKLTRRNVLSAAVVRLNARRSVYMRIETNCKCGRLIKIDVHIVERLKIENEELRKKIQILELMKVKGYESIEDILAGRFK